MGEFRDWPSTLRRASFRGVAFFVETDDVETGRRLIVHEFPKRDVPYVEDMGRKANRISVTAYLVGDAADSEAMSLRGACESAGAATLVLPMERLKAHCESCKRNFKKDQLGYVAFDLQFVREGTGSSPEPAPYLARLTSSAADATVTPLTDTFSSSYRVTGQAGFVRDESADEIRSIAAAIDAVRAVLPLSDTKGPPVTAAVQDLYDDAEALVDVGAVGDIWTQTTFQAASAGSIDAPVVSRIAGLVASMREAATDPEAVVREFEDLLSYGLDSDGQAATPSSRQLRENRSALALALRVAALSQWVVAMTEVEYGDRRAAIQARANVSEAIESELSRLTTRKAYGLFVAVSDLRGVATAFFSSLITDLAPVVIVSTVVPMPSLWLAHMLYGDASRADELAKRNRVIHPSFMPTDIEALAR